MTGKIIVLAGGKGTRMNGGDLPKVLIELKGRPMIEYVLSAIKVRPIVVVGYKSEEVKLQLGERVDYVFQSEQLGTGHAVACAREVLNNYDGPIVVLYGDQPLLRKETIDKLFNLYFNERANLSMLTTQVDDFDDWRQGFNSFGRILRDSNQKLQSIRELRDCSEEEKRIREVNPGYYCFNSKWLWQNIDRLNNNNKQKEYYLTDLVEIAVQQGEKIATGSIEAKECLGINTKEQLGVVEKFL